MATCIAASVRIHTSIVLPSDLSLAALFVCVQSVVGSTNRGTKLESNGRSKHESIGMTSRSTTTNTTIIIIIINKQQCGTRGLRVLHTPAWHGMA